MNDTIAIVVAFIACSVSIYLIYTSIKDILFWKKKKKFYEDLLLAIKSNDIPKIKEYLNSKYLDNYEVRNKLIENLQLWEKINKLETKQENFNSFN